MSSTEEVAAKEDLKGGHPPAVKAGGMRIVQHKKELEKDETPQMTPEEEEEYGSSPPKTDTHHSTAVVSGAVTKFINQGHAGQPANLITVLKQHFSDEAAYISFTKEHADIAAFVRWPEAMFLDKFGDKDFPPQAVKHFHTKPQPTHEKPRPAQVQQHIFQPR